MTPLRIAMVAAEPSGDQLGAALMQALRGRFPSAAFEGVGGDAMAAEGLNSRIPMDRLGVMGLVEVLAHLPALLKERRDLGDHWTRNPPDVFIGIDAPDFNLGLAARLRKAGIPTVQYVAPTVWAWRESRVKTLRRSVDLVLSIFPFEEQFLQERGVNAVYTGHPLADRIPLDVDQAGARQALDLSPEGMIVALLPGSRRSEMEKLAGPFLETANWCHERRPGLRYVVPLAGDAVAAAFEQARSRFAPRLPLQTVRRRSHEVLAAADVALTASGTATLEALLTKRPMIVGYRVHQFTYLAARYLRLVKTPWVAMANILASEELAPEFLQTRCAAPFLGPALLALLDDPERRARIGGRYRVIHERMRCSSNQGGAAAVADLLAGRAP